MLKNKPKLFKIKLPLHKIYKVTANVNELYQKALIQLYKISVNWHDDEVNILNEELELIFPLN